jgi:hypothetical protein
MKKALEWFNKWRGSENDSEMTDEQFMAVMVRNIEQIQLDAWRQGMEDARQICLNHKNNACEAGFASQFDCAESIKEHSEKIDSWGVFI